MTLSALLTLLSAAASWNTACVQTQLQNGTSMQGYLVEQISFGKNDGKHEVLYTLTRDWHKEADCSDHAFKTETVTGSMIGGDKIESSFGTQAGETVFEADFKIESRTEKGAIAISGDQKTVRIARGFGQGRNTMLSLVGYTAQK